MKILIFKLIFFILIIVFFLLTNNVWAEGKEYWSTKEGKIVDKNGEIVRIAGINWGLNPYNKEFYGQFFGSTKANYKDILKAIKNYGFNTIRLTWVYQHIDPDCKFNNSGKKNNELVGLSCLEVLDKIIEYAGEINLRVILDHHSRNRRGFTSDKWLPAWQKLARRYKENKIIIGADLDNEPDTCWGCGTDYDWKKAAEKAGNSILLINPNWLIIVEDFPGTNNLVNIVKTNPIKLILPNKLVYSTHIYNWGDEALWDQAFGNLVKNKIVPVLVGEFNLHYISKKQLEWFDNFTRYLKANDIGALAWAWLYDDPQYANEPWYVKSLVNPDYLTLQNDDRKKSLAYWYNPLDPIKLKSSPTPTPFSSPIEPGPITETIISPTPTTDYNLCVKNLGGDANKDGKTNLIDFEIWRREFNGESNYQTADFNCDGRIDFNDFEQWKINFK
jgi:endoglucanase